MRVAIFGRTSMLYKTIQLLAKTNNEIVLIGTCKEAPEYKTNALEFELLAQKLKVPFFNTTKINSEEIVQLIKKLQPDIAISFNWLTIIGDEVISNIKYGILNAHCGDLPRYRGNACPNWAILNNEKKIGISIHYMEPNELDSGDIVIKEFYPINDTTTITEFYEYIEDKIPVLFLEAINKIVNNKDYGERQSKNKKDVLRCYSRIPSDSLINWNATNKEIDSLIRASCNPFAGAYTYYEKLRIFITKARREEYEYPSIVIPGQVIKVNKKMDEVAVATGNGVIIIEEIYLENKIKVSVSQILASTRIRLGYVLEDKIYQLERRIEELEKNKNL